MQHRKVLAVALALKPERAKTGADGGRVCEVGGGERRGGGCCQSALCVCGGSGSHEAGVALGHAGGEGGTDVGVQLALLPLHDLLSGLQSRGAAQACAGNDVVFAHQGAEDPLQGVVC